MVMYLVTGCTVEAAESRQCVGARVSGASLASINLGPHSELGFPLVGVPSRN